MMLSVSFFLLISGSLHFALYTHTTVDTEPSAFHYCAFFVLTGMQRRLSHSLNPQAVVAPLKPE